MRIRNHRLGNDDGSAVRYEASRNVGGALTPEYLVIHYTAGSSLEGAVRTLTARGTRVSAHLVIGRDGTVVQLVPFNRVAWHAGRSRWEGRTGLNHYAIGIELDNVGWLSRQGNRWTSWFGRAYDEAEVIVAAHPHEGIERGWQTFPEAQITAVRDVATVLVDHYKLLDVIGHQDIAPGRKLDPGPVFPMASIRSAALGRAEDDLPHYSVITHLNIRTGPGIDHDRLPASPLPPGTRLTLLETAGAWGYVEVLSDGDAPQLNGWVHRDYLRRA